MQWSVFSMKLKEQQNLDLNRIVTALSELQNVVGIILFGSQARGDYDEFSDYDLLILFENKHLMWQTWDKIFQTVASLKMNLHAIPETLEELRSANPVFLEELSKNGKVLYAKIPLDVSLKPVNLEAFTLITYNMSKASYAEKMKASYYLYSKNGSGAVAEAGGTKIGNSCILIRSDMAENIIGILTSLNVQTKKMEIFASPNHLTTQQPNELQSPQLPHL
jgi:predicted nucleotidyltransferase